MRYLMLNSRHVKISIINASIYFCYYLFYSFFKFIVNLSLFLSLSLLLLLLLLSLVCLICLVFEMYSHAATCFFNLVRLSLTWIIVSGSSSSKLPSPGLILLRSIVIKPKSALRNVIILESTSRKNISLLQNTDLLSFSNNLLVTYQSGTSFNVNS